MDSDPELRLSEKDPRMLKCKRGVILNVFWALQACFLHQLQCFCQQESWSWSQTRGAAKQHFPSTSFLQASILLKMLKHHPACPGIRFLLLPSAVRAFSPPPADFCRINICSACWESWWSNTLRVSERASSSVFTSSSSPLWWWWWWWWWWSNKVDAYKSSSCLKVWQSLALIRSGWASLCFD